MVDQTQAVKFALDIACGMAFLHTLEPMISRHSLNSKSVMVREGLTLTLHMHYSDIVVMCFTHASYGLVDDFLVFETNCYNDLIFLDRSTRT